MHMHRNILMQYYIIFKSKDHYRGMNKLLFESSQNMTASNPSSIFIGTSVACPAIGLYLANKGSRVVVGSPIFDAHTDITEKLLGSENKLLAESFMATYADNAIDKRFKDIYSKLSHMAGKKNVCDMSQFSSSHASLGTTIITRDFEKILNWLSFENNFINVMS